MIKILLCPILIFIGGYIGFRLARRYKNRVDELTKCELMLNKIRVYIEYENIKTSEVLSRLYMSESLEPLTFIKICHEKLKNDNNFPLMWNKSLLESKSTLSLKEEDYALLRQLSEIIGSCDANGVKNSIEVIQCELKDRIAGALEQNSVTGNLCKKLGVLSGIATAIILI